MMSWRVAYDVLAYFLANARWGEIAWGGRLRIVDKKEQSLCHGRHACQDALDGIQFGQPVRLTAPCLFQGAELLAKSRISWRSKCARILKDTLAFHYVDDKKGS